MAVAQLLQATWLAVTGAPVEILAGAGSAALAWALAAYCAWELRCARESRDRMIDHVKDLLNEKGRLERQAAQFARRATLRSVPFGVLSGEGRSA